MPKQLSILLVEDDSIEAMKFNRTVAKLDIDCSITEVKNGEEGIKFLKENKSLPNIILLDLNMPKMNGIEFLKILKGDDVLKYIPTIILTTSCHQKDLLDCYKIGVAGYMIKPLKYSEYASKMASIISYWSESELVSV